MKQRLLVFLLVLGVSWGLKEKKVNLHDIERDNLANEKKLKEERTTQAPKYSQSFVPQHQQSFVSSPTQFGFIVPNSVKPVQQFVQPQYSVPFQQYYTLPPQYRGQQQYAKYQQYQQYENVPYVTDNHIGQQQQQQQQQQQPTYYTQPQYVYVQPFTAASTNVPSVISAAPKGGVQYVMYIPTPTYVQPIKGEQTQTYENVVPAEAYVNVIPQAYATTNEQQPQLYATTQQTQTTPTDAQYQTQYQTQYVTQPQTPKIVQYVQPKREPQSLLDSYVPSALQIQYYKQQQNEINAIRQTKISPPLITGKTEYVKTRLPQTQQAESTFTYTYQLPSYSHYAIKK